MNSHETIKKVIENICEQKEANIFFSLDKSDDITHGDYSTNVALVAFSLQSKETGIKFKELNLIVPKYGFLLSPYELAEKLSLELKNKLSDIVDDVVPAGPGFINFFLKDEVIRKENEGRSIVTNFSGKNILVEHSSPNLFKPFSIGHLMNNIIGEFVTRATKEGGANVKSISFPSDVSLGIAKALMIIEKDIKEERVVSNFFEVDSEDVVIKYLGEAYVRGINECDSNEESLNYAKKVLDKMYKTKEGDDFYNLILEIRKINESYFKAILFNLDSHIDIFAYESHAGILGEKVVRENIGKVFVESEGAVVYIPEESCKDINTSVFINSQGYPTYEAKDLGLLQIKFEQIENFRPEISIFVTDAEQTQHFKVVFDAVSKISDEWKNRVEKSKHIPHGRMLFKGQKMSSRLGGVPLAIDVVNEIETEVELRSGDKINNLSSKEKGDIWRQIALSALRISVLRSKPGLNINFDPETSLSFEGDSGPYLMYTHARCASLLEKGKDIIPAWGDFEVTSLEKHLIHFERILEETINDLSPQKLVTYLFEVSQLFNAYYAQEQIIADGDGVGNAHRLMIVKRVKDVLNKGLNVLGIVAPNKM